METRHYETRKPGFKQEKEINTTVTEGTGSGGSGGSGSHDSTPSSPTHLRQRRRPSSSSSISSQAQQLIPNVSKQQLAYGLPIALAILFSLLFLGFKSSSYFHPAPPPPTLTEKFTHKLDSFGHTVGGEYWEALKQKTASLSSSASEIADSVMSSPGLEKLKLKAEELKAEADKQYAAAEAKAQELAGQAKKAGTAGAAKAGLKVDNLKENSQDAYARASLNSAGVAENVRHAVNEATEAVRHAAAETQESLRHRAATMQNAAQQKVQDVKETVHNIKQTIKDKI